MTASPRRVGAETSKTRDALLDRVERMMLEDGYASVTYRAPRRKPASRRAWCRTTSPLRRRLPRRHPQVSDRNLEVLTTALQTRSRIHCVALREYRWDEATGAPTTEFMALAITARPSVPRSPTSPIASARSNSMR